ncbi:tyrosine-type recombinase/integrase [Symbiopectobacterium purcellii]|uniref:tyrosine-type recombinase/integrase n=1 Tax=Symbiopectobacterium purcellii TaxID=2871826 RepID=UPI003F867C85
MLIGILLSFEGFPQNAIYTDYFTVSFSQTTHIDCLNLCLADVLNQFRRLNNGRAHIVANAKYKQFAAKTISAAFLKARRISGLIWERKPPSFHEIRSLSARLYTDEKGKEYAQKLLGHKSSAMTDRYRDDRGAEWKQIE